MSKNGKLKKAQNVEKRRLQLEEAMECVALKQAAETLTVIVPRREPGHALEHRTPKPFAENRAVTPLRRQPKQCTFHHCGRYVDAKCTVCPYCGHPLPE